jgi:hypothetical protein
MAEPWTAEAERWRLIAEVRSIALKAALAEIERLRYAQDECPGCKQRVHAADCRLVKTLEIGRAAVAKAEGA